MSESLRVALARLQEDAEEMGHCLPPDSLRTLGRWAGLVVEWRGAAQLTGLRSAASVVTELMIPALYALRVVAARPGMHIVDFGCGSGCTGVALAAASSRGNWYLLDRDEKKVTFCRYALGRCRIAHVASCSPEEFAGQEVQADVVLARALPRRHDALREAALLLKTDGVVVRWLPESEAQPLPGAVPCGDSGVWVVSQPRQCFT
jgi:16S rRNA G527 N7-methylase RsmG